MGVSHTVCLPSVINNLYIGKKHFAYKVSIKTNFPFFSHLRPLIVYLRKFYYYDPEEEMYLSIKGMRQAAGVEQEAESET